MRYQEAHAAHQGMPPIGFANQGCPIGGVRRQARSDAAIDFEILLGTRFAPQEVQRVQVIRRALAVGAEPVEHAIRGWWAGRSGGHEGSAAA